MLTLRSPWNIGVLQRTLLMAGTHEPQVLFSASVVVSEFEILRFVDDGLL